MQKILLIEDQLKLCIILKETLALYNYDVSYCENGASGVKQFFLLKPDLVILDIMLPKMNGFEVITQLRNQEADIPILMLTARSQTADLVKAFDLGCTDYLKKPFNMDELLARIGALLKRNEKARAAATTQVYRFGRFIFNHHTMQLLHGDSTIQLSFKEAEILARLCMHLNQVVERKALLLALWGDDNLFNSKTMNVYITRLRNYLAGDPDITIVNIRGIGYKLIDHHAFQF